MCHGEDFYEEQIPLAYAGKTLSDRALAIWLAQTHPNRVIGRLVPGPEWPEPAVDDLDDTMDGAAREARDKALFDIEQLKKRGLSIPPLMAEAAKMKGATKAEPEPIWTGPIPQDVVDWARANNATPMQVRKKLEEKKRELEAQNAPKRKMPTNGGRTGTGRNTRRKVGT
jgi:hypothetical protein